jgi:hypothetical protein
MLPVYIKGVALYIPNAEITISSVM